MRIENEALLDYYRSARYCEYCRRSTPSGCDPAHIFSRGAGRLDVPCNLVSLCRECHTKSHAAHSWNKLRPNRDDLLLIVAERQCLRVEDIVDEIHRLRRLRK